MSDKIINITTKNSILYDNIPIIRYTFGITFILAVTSLINYELSYLTTVLSLGYIAPGARPLKLKQGLGFVFSLIIITGLSVAFSAIFLDYPLVFMPLMALALLWIYYTDKLAVMVKLFSIISILLIPLISLEANAIGSFIAVNLVLNAFMAIILTQFVFWIFPWDETDKKFEKQKQSVVQKTENERFIYALNIITILLPLLLLFFIFKLTGGLLILIFTAILSFSPALANAKAGSIMIIANIFGGIFAILAYKFLVIVPHFTFLILITLSIALFFGARIFSNNKFAAVFSSGFSTFLLILGSVTSSDAEAGNKVWVRVIQIAIAVIYVVVSFRILNQFNKSKKHE